MPKRKASFAFQYEDPFKFVDKRHSPSALAMKVKSSLKKPAVAPFLLPPPPTSAVRATETASTNAVPSLRRDSTLPLAESMEGSSSSDGLSRRSSTRSKTHSLMKRHSSISVEDKLVTRLSSTKSGSVVGATRFIGTDATNESVPLSKKSSIIKAGPSKIKMPTELTNLSMPSSAFIESIMKLNDSDLIREVGEEGVSSALASLKLTLSTRISRAGSSVSAPTLTKLSTASTLSRSSSKARLSKSASTSSNKSKAGPVGFADVLKPNESDEAPDVVTPHEPIAGSSASGPSGAYDLPHSDLVEVALSFDTTGSMHGYLEEVRAKMQDLIQRLQADIPGIRIAVIAHGDYFDADTSYVIQWIDFTTNMADLCGFVRDVGPTHGGDCYECYELALRVDECCGTAVKQRTPFRSFLCHCGPAISGHRYSDLQKNIVSDRFRERTRTLSWTPGSRRLLIMISDSCPHLPEYWFNGYLHTIDWRVECAALRDMVSDLMETPQDRVYPYDINRDDVPLRHCLVPKADHLLGLCSRATMTANQSVKHYHIENGVRIYGIFAGGSNHGGKRFSEQISSMTGGLHMTMSNFGALFDLIMMICYREGNPAMLQAYVNAIAARTTQEKWDCSDISKKLADTSIRKAHPVIFGPPAAFPLFSHAPGMGMVPRGMPIGIGVPRMVGGGLPMGIDATRMIPKGMPIGIGVPRMVGGGLPMGIDATRMIPKGMPIGIGVPRMVGGGLPMGIDATRMIPKGMPIGIGVPRMGGGGLPMGIDATRMIPKGMPIGIGVPRMVGGGLPMGIGVPRMGGGGLPMGIDATSMVPRGLPMGIGATRDKKKKAKGKVTEKAKGKTTSVKTATQKTQKKVKEERKLREKISEGSFCIGRLKKIDWSKWSTFVVQKTVSSEKKKGFRQIASRQGMRATSMFGDDFSKPSIYEVAVRSPRNSKMYPVYYKATHGFTTTSLYKFLFGPVLILKEVEEAISQGLVVSVRRGRPKYKSVVAKKRAVDEIRKYMDENFDYAWKTYLSRKRLHRSAKIFRKGQNEITISHDDFGA